MAVKWKTESAGIIIEKGTEVQNSPKSPPTPSLVESLLQRVLCRVDLLLGLKEYALPLPVQLCRIYGGLTVWKCQRAFISLLLKHEVCHHCSDLFPCEGIALVDFENPCF